MVLCPSLLEAKIVDFGSRRSESLWVQFEANFRSKLSFYCKLILTSNLYSPSDPANAFIGLAACPPHWQQELTKLSKLNPESIEYEQEQSDKLSSAPNAFSGFASLLYTFSFHPCQPFETSICCMRIATDIFSPYSGSSKVFLCAMSRGFVFPLRKNSASTAQVVFSTPQAQGSICWLVAHPQGESRALEAAVSQTSVVFAIKDLSTFLSPIYVVVQRPGDFVAFPSGCFFQGHCCDNSTLLISTVVPPYAASLLSVLNDALDRREELSAESKARAFASAVMPDDPHFHPTGPQPTPRRVGPYSLFPTIRQVLAEAGASGIEVFHIVDILNRDSRFLRTLPSNLSPTIAVLLALNFMRTRTHSKSNGMFEKQYVAPLKSSDLPAVAADRVKWRWVGEKATKERIAEVLFELETAYWFAITRQMYRLDFGKKVFEILYDVGAPKQPPDTQAYTPSQRAELHKQEQLRFMHPDFAFEYRITGTVPVCVGPIENVASVTMKTSHLVMDRPPAAKVTTVVADAAARLPGGVGSRADVERLLLESQYTGQELRSNADLVRSTVTGALDRMSRAEDPPVKFCREVKLWVYRYRQRLPADFALDAEDEPPLRAQKKVYLVATPLTSPPVPAPSDPLATSDLNSSLSETKEASVGPMSPPTRALGKLNTAETNSTSPVPNPGPQPPKARYYGPALMTATKMPGLRTIWWSAPGNRRPAFSGVAPRRLSVEDTHISPAAHERHEVMYKIIRETRREAAEVETEALTLGTTPKFLVI